MGRAARLVEAAVTVKRRRKLNRIIASGSSEQRLVLRARIILAAAEGTPNAVIAAALGCSVLTVRTWRGRFALRGIPGLFDRPRTGRPAVHGPSVRLVVVATATAAPPDGQTAWSHVTIAAHLDERGVEISPAGAVLVSIDERTGIQAKTRTYPEIPLRPGRAARREFEYVRYGTVSIIAAMDVATGEVVTERIGRNTSAAFTAFLAMLDERTDPAPHIHLIMDNGSSHTAGATRAWLKAHPRFSATYTPKHASWLNMVVQWFGVLTRRLLRRGDFTSREDLDAQITAFTILHNKTAQPYQWSYDADAEHARYLERHPSPTSLTQAA